MAVELISIADDLVTELNMKPVNAGNVAQNVMKYMGARLRMNAFFKENPTT